MSVPCETRNSQSQKPKRLSTNVEELAKKVTNSNILVQMPRVRNQEALKPSVSPRSPLRTSPSPNFVNQQSLKNNREQSVTNEMKSDATVNSIKAGTKQTDSFYSKDRDVVLVGKLAAKLDCGSMLSKRSNNFKTLSPVNVADISGIDGVKKHDYTV